MHICRSWLILDIGDIDPMPDDIPAKVHNHLSNYPKRIYPKGQILVFAGENPEHIFYIVKGRVRKYDVSYRGDEIILNIFKPPAFFPVSWALNHTSNKYFYKTETETELHIIPTRDIRSFLEENPDVTLDLLSRVYLGLEGVYGRLVQLMAGTARGRLIHELVIETRRFGEVQPSGNFKLQVTETDLAAHSGLSRETVSREIHQLKERGWLRVANKQIIVTDFEALESALNDVS